MASVDKLYGSYEQYIELGDYLAREFPFAKRFMSTSASVKRGGSLALFPLYVDWFLWENCQLDWVREQLKSQYGLEDGDDFLDDVLL